MPPEVHPHIWFLQFGTFATHSGLVHDFTDTNCWAQNGSAHSNGVFFVLFFVCVPFKCWLLQTGEEIKWKTAVCLFKFYSMLLTGPGKLHCFRSPSTSRHKQRLTVWDRFIILTIKHFHRLLQCQSEYFSLDAQSISQFPHKSAILNAEQTKSARTLTQCYCRPNLQQTNPALQCIVLWLVLCGTVQESCVSLWI